MLRILNTRWRRIKSTEYFWYLNSLKYVNTNYFWASKSFKHFAFVLIHCQIFVNQIRNVFEIILILSWNCLTTIETNVIWCATTILIKEHHLISNIELNRVIISHILENVTNIAVEQKEAPTLYCTSVNRLRPRRTLFSSRINVHWSCDSYLCRTIVYSLKQQIERASRTILALTKHFKPQEYGTNM